MGAVSRIHFDANVGDRQITDTGTPESDWAAWPGLDQFPVIEATELVPLGHRIVIVAPHPDDEILGAGGLLAQLTRVRRIDILGVTDGGASHTGSTQWPRHELIKTRRTERLAGLSQLGFFQTITPLGFEDGQVGAEERKLTLALSRYLQPGDVVFAPWRLDGHPDHEATGRATHAACRARRARLIEMPIWMWHWARPADARVPWASAVRVECLGNANRKASAIHCHRSQLDPDMSTGAAAVLPDWALARWLRPFEVFFT